MGKIHGDNFIKLHRHVYHAVTMCHKQEKHLSPSLFMSNLPLAKIPVGALSPELYGIYHIQIMCQKQKLELLFSLVIGYLPLVKIHV